MKVRTEAKRLQILGVARRLFMERGFEATSMSELAREVGGSKGTLYSYFPSKEELFVAAAETEGVRMIKALVGAVEMDASAALKDSLPRVAEAFVAFWTSPDTIAAYRMVMAEAGRSDIGRLFFDQGPAEGRRRMAAIFGKAMERGEICRADPLVAADHFMALLRSESERLYFERASPSLSAEDTQAMAQRAVAVMLRAYAPELRT